MIKVINEKHPRLKVYDEATQKEELRQLAVCKTKTGCHDCCSRNRRNSALAQYGVGSVLYFQFLKCMGCLFLLMGVLAFPAMLFFFYGTELADSSFTKIVAAASLGNLGSSDPVCNEAKYDLSQNTNKQNPSVTISLSCKFGTLWSIKEFGQISVSTPNNCEEALKEPDNAQFDFYPPDCDYNLFEDADYETFSLEFDRQCKGKKDC